MLEETNNPLRAEDIAQTVGLNVFEVYEHLTHIAKTIRRQSKNAKALFMMPSKCRKCGYIFSDIDKPKKPSRCPKCKSEWIEPPRFIIKTVDSE